MATALQQICFVLTSYAPPLTWKVVRAVRNERREHAVPLIGRPKIVDALRGSRLLGNKPHRRGRL